MLACVDKRWRCASSLLLLLSQLLLLQLQLLLLLPLVLVIDVDKTGVLRVILGQRCRRRCRWVVSQAHAHSSAHTNTRRGHGRARLTHYRAHKTIGHDKVSEKLITSNVELLAKGHPFRRDRLIGFVCALVS